ncbi:hypothetical protein F5Y16DRAFT_402406 [Xylariaceae sp. FL0255]|nr:hypothetical protein F5Y16DRAFT_402406 [Xylariaceae sp. FL0255]
MSGMTGNNYEDLCSRIYTRIEHSLTYPTTGENVSLKRFATKNVASDAIREDQIRDFFRSLQTTRHTGFHFTISEAEFVREVQRRKLEPFIATMIFASFNHEVASYFVNNVVGHTASASFRLPLTKDQLESIFPRNSRSVDNFMHNQECFCALEMVGGRGETLIIEKHDDPRLPYVHQAQKGKGSFGIVWEVDIADGHYATTEDDGTKSYTQGIKKVARKDYFRATFAARDFKKERDNFIRIQNSASRHKHIVESLGTIEYTSEQTFSHFMPLADDDLGKYMQKHRNNENMSQEDMINHLNCVVNIAQALHFLHKELKAPDGSKLTCYHMDIKPNNILVFHYPSGMTWKISDFGFSVVKTVEGSVASDTLHVAAEGPYHAPESTKPKPQVKKWHTRITEQATASGNKKLLVPISKCLIDKVLIADPSKRHKASQVGDEIHSFIVDVVKGRPFVDSDRTSQATGGSMQAPRKTSSAFGGRKLSLIPFHRPSSTKKWWLSHSTASSPQACYFTQDEEHLLLCYYCPQNDVLELYYATNNFPDSGELQPSTTPYMHRASITSIALTWRTAIIAERKNHFSLAVARFVDSRANGPSFQGQPLISITYPMIPPVSLVTISPRGNRIACIVESRRSPATPVRVYYANRYDILIAPESSEHLWKHVDIPSDWTPNGASHDITSLRFSDEKTLWLAIEPLGQMKTRVVIVPNLNRTDGTTPEMKPLKIPKSVSGHVKDTLTCFTPFNNSERFVIVTDKNEINIVDFSAAEPRFRFNPPKATTAKVEILRIVISQDDKRVLALVKPNGKFHVLSVVEVILEDVGIEVPTIYIEDLEVHYGNYNLQNIDMIWVEDERNPEANSRLLIATLVRNGDAVFEVEIPNSNRG